ncbi:MAG: hypothetical protein ABIU77_06645 [Ferruginibacter sp.]
MLTFYDAILTPVYFLLILALLIIWKKRYYKQTTIAKYIIPCFVLKSFCCIFLACLYHFYYGYSDSQTYFNGSQEIWHAAKENPMYGLELIFKPVEKCSIGAQKYAIQLANPIQNGSTIAIFKIAGFLGLFCFGTYIPISLFFSLLAFIGTWRIFKVFYTLYPEYHKSIAAGCLFAPSALLWGTNILKDPLCMYALGLCITTLYSIIQRKITLVNLIEFLIGSVILLLIKEYIFYIFLLAVLITLVVMYKSQHSLIRIIFRFFTILFLLAGIIWAYSNIQFLGNLVYTNFTGSAINIQNAQAALTEEGASGYSIPDVTDFSLWGIIRTYLLSLNVALFRPYVWEVRNPLMLLNAMESLTVLLLTIYLLVKTKLTGFFKFSLQNSFLFFALTFSLLIAPLAGFVSFNFGTLVRYKFPAVPLFYTYLLLLFDTINKKLNSMSKFNK